MMTRKKITPLALAVLFVSTPFALCYDGPKVFVESVSQPYQEQSWLFRGKTTTGGEMAPAAAIERVLAKGCLECIFVPKKDRADYVLTFVNTSSGYEWSVVDNSGDGRRVASKRVILEANAYSNAIAAVKDDWAKKLGPQPKILKWEMIENPDGIYEIPVSQSEVGPGGVRVKLTIKKSEPQSVEKK